MKPVYSFAMTIDDKVWYIHNLLSLKLFFSSQQTRHFAENVSKVVGRLKQLYGFYQNSVNTKTPNLFMCARQKFKNNIYQHSDVPNIYIKNITTYAALNETSFCSLTPNNSRDFSISALHDFYISAFTAVIKWKLYVYYIRKK